MASFFQSLTNDDELKEKNTNRPVGGEDSEHVKER